MPVTGAIGVTLLVVNFAPEAKGHGVPEVMDAIYYDRRIIRPVVTVIKSVASALAIGSGAEVGLGPFIPAIDAILEADRDAPVKQRHTARRIFERLRDEHGYTGFTSSEPNYLIKDIIRYRHVAWSQRSHTLDKFLDVS